MTHVTYGGYVHDAILDVTGRRYINTVFHRCILTRDEHPENFDYGCIYTECTFRGNGWPEWMTDDAVKGSFLTETGAFTR